MMRIGIVSDTHFTRRAPATRDNFAAACAFVAGAGCAQLLHLGDVTADGATRPEDRDCARDWLSAAPLVPRALPGNHDIGEPPTSPSAQSGAEITVDAASVSAFQAAFGADRWIVEAEGWTLIGLNAQIIGAPDLEDAQWSFLDHALKGRAGPIGLFLHKPLFRDSPAALERHGRYVAPDGARRLLATLAPHDLRFVCSGHTHQYRTTVVDGVEHAWAPSLCYTFPDSIQETIGRKCVGMLMLDLDRHRHCFSLETPPGVVQQSLADLPALYPALLARA